MFEYSNEEKIEIFKKIARSHLLEEFLHIKFSTHKRFGLDGIESLVSLVESVIERAADNGVDTFVIGMPHRGRLNIMKNVLNFPLDEMIGEFLGTKTRSTIEGDVKYHLGHTSTRKIRGKNVNITLLANPSHLEAVDPLTYGHTRAI